MPTVSVNGISLHYVEQGHGNGLLLVHGLGTGAADWENQLPALSPHFRVIVPCLRGFGESERPPGPYTMGGFADDLIQLMDALGIDRFHLCGVSMGGAIAFELAARWPGRVHSLIVINSQPSFALDTVKKRLLFGSRRWLARILGLERLARLQARLNFPGREYASLRASLRGRFHNTPGPYLAALDAVGNWQVLSELHRISAPTLFIAAEHDYTSPAEKAYFASLLHDARVEIVAGARHAVHVERPDQVNQIMLRFLRSIERREHG